MWWDEKGCDVMEWQEIEWDRMRSGVMSGSSKAWVEIKRNKSRMGCDGIGLTGIARQGMVWGVMG